MKRNLFEGIHNDTRSLFEAIKNNNIEITKNILDSMPKYANIFDSKGCTPLCIASREGYIDIVRLLLEYGVDPNLPNNDEDKDSPLMCSVGDGVNDINIVKMLLLAGANVNYENYYLNTPLIFSCGVSEFDGAHDLFVYVKLLPILKLLIDWGADPFQGERPSSEVCMENQCNMYLTKELQGIEADMIYQDSLVKPTQRLALAKTQDHINRMVGQDLEPDIFRNISGHLSSIKLNRHKKTGLNKKIKEDRGSGSAAAPGRVIPRSRRRKRKKTKKTKKTKKRKE
tara:strand:+ start:471 stop:1322 length:852 start_codon:yes stop_codon:yes gene_type:complete